MHFNMEDLGQFEKVQAMGFHINTTIMPDLLKGGHRWMLG
jgi:hypothetical protein